MNLMSCLLLIVLCNEFVLKHMLVRAIHDLVGFLMIYHTRHKKKSRGVAFIIFPFNYVRTNEAKFTQVGGALLLLLVLFTA